MVHPNASPIFSQHQSINPLQYKKINDKNIRISIDIICISWRLMCIPRKVEVQNQEFKLTDKKVVAVLERTVTPFGNSAKADVPVKYVGKRVYVVILG